MIHFFGVHWAIILGVGAVLGLLANAIHVVTFVKSRLWVPLVSRLRAISPKDREDIDAELAGLRRQVEYLTKVVAELRARDEMSWAWILSDQEWHRKYELQSVERGWESIPHVGYSEFRENWLRSHEDWHPFD